MTDRDLVIRSLADGPERVTTAVSEFMTAAPITIEPEVSVDEALHRMAQAQVRRLCVAKDGAVVGIVSLYDLAVVPQLFAEAMRRQGRAATA
ncbi:MAG: CBS domain-containing protein [Dehalococcoidia bacterium]